MTGRCPRRLNKVDEDGHRDIEHDLDLQGPERAIDGIQPVTLEHAGQILLDEIHEQQIGGDVFQPAERKIIVESQRADNP